MSSSDGEEHESEVRLENQMHDQLKDAGSDVAVVPLSIMQNVIQESKKLVQTKRLQDERMSELEHTIETQKSHIDRLERLCSQMGKANRAVNLISKVSTKWKANTEPYYHAEAEVRVSRDEPRPTANQNVGTLEALPAGTHLSNHQIKHNQEYRNIINATNRISSQRTLNEAIQNILVSACRLLHCPSTALYLVDQRRKKLLVSTGYKQDMEITGADPVELPLDRRNSVIGHVVQTKEQLALENLESTCEFYSPSIDNRSRYRTVRSMLCHPIFSRDGHEVIAVLQSLNRIPDEENDLTTSAFTTKDRATIGNVANAASNALNILSLYTDASISQKRMTGLLNILQDVQEGSCVDDVIRSILDRSSKLILECERLSFFMVTADRKHLVISHSVDAAGIRLPIAGGIVGHVATTGEDLMVADAYADSRFDSSVDTKTGFVTRYLVIFR